MIDTGVDSANRLWDTDHYDFSTREKHKQQGQAFINELEY